MTPGALAALADRGARLHRPRRPGARGEPELPQRRSSRCAARGARIAGADIGEPGWGTCRRRRLRSSSSRPAAGLPDPRLPQPDRPAHGRRAPRPARRARCATPGRSPIIDETHGRARHRRRADAAPLRGPPPGAITLGSASKTFWGGLRIGWIRAPHARMQALVTSRLTPRPRRPRARAARTRAPDEPARAGPRHPPGPAGGVPRRPRLGARLAGSRPGASGCRPAGSPVVRAAPARRPRRWPRSPRGTASSSPPARSSPPRAGSSGYVRLPFTRPPAQTLTEAVERLAAAWDDLSTAVPSRRKPLAAWSPDRWCA